MIFFVGNDGTIIKSVPSNVNQGSANANNIYLIAPFAANLSVAVAFKLPNGVIIPPDTMSRMGEIEGVINEKTGKPYAGWQYALPNSITEYFGTVTAQFFFFSAQAGVIVGSSATSFPVEKGVPSVLPTAPSPDVYQKILDNVTLLQQQLNNGSFAARAMYAWNSAYTYGAGEIVFYPNHGTAGVFVKSLVTNNKTEPYTNGVLNSANWQLEVDFDEVNKVLGLQPIFEQTLADAQAEVNKANAAAAAAATSATNAQASATNAQETAERLTELTDYISDVKEGAQAVPKSDSATNDGNGNNIAQSIQELREDMQNESHFRGYLATNAEIQALPGTPNDYAYSAESGTVWIYQTATGWTNSGKSVPDQTVPASNTAPLRDGAASAGTANAYARGDHRHPTDTTRASTAVATTTANGLMSAADKQALETLKKGTKIYAHYITLNFQMTPTHGTTGIKGACISFMLLVRNASTSFTLQQLSDYLLDIGFDSSLMQVIPVSGTFNPPVSPAQGITATYKNGNFIWLTYSTSGIGSEDYVEWSVNALTAGIAAGTTYYEDTVIALN